MIKVFSSIFLHIDVKILNSYVTNIIIIFKIKIIFNNDYNKKIFKISCYLHAKILYFWNILPFMKQYII